MTAMNITKYAIVLTAFLVTFGSAAQTPGGSGAASGTIPPFPAPDVVLKPSALTNGHVSLSPSGTFAVYAGTANSSIVAIAFSRDGRWLAAGWNPVSLIDVWDINSRKKTQTLQAAQGGIDALAFGPDGTLLASGAESNSVRTWNWSKKKLKSDFQGHKTYLETWHLTLLAAGWSLPIMAKRRSCAMGDHINKSLNSTRFLPVLDLLTDYPVTGTPII